VSSSQDAVRECMVIAIATLTYNCHSRHGLFRLLLDLPLSCICKYFGSPNMILLSLESARCHTCFPQRLISHVGSHVRTSPSSLSSTFFKLLIAKISFDRVLESLTCLWWLISFALLANDASNLNNLESLSVSDYGVTVNVGDYLPSKYITALSCEKAAAGLGALEWLLFVITLVMFGT
jgi:hypothetical protein